MKKLVIFDLDGTILDTLKDLTNSVNKTLKLYNLKMRKEDEVKYFLGRGPRYLLEKSFNETFTESKYNEVFKIYDEIYNKHKTDYTKPYDGIIEILKALKQKGYLLAVCSNKQHSATVKLIEDLFSGLFDVVMGTTKRLQPKPDKAMVEEILKVLNVSKDNTIYVGDTEIDIMTAINADIKKIAVLYGFRTKEDLDKYSPEYYASSALEVLDIILNEL